MDTQFNNERTLTHEFFTSERHFINYCLRVCKSNGISNTKITIKNLDHFAWSLAHETVFKRNFIKPPYAILISALKNNYTQTELDFLFGDFLTELMALRYGNKELKDCALLIKNEIYDGSGYSIQCQDWGYTPKMIKAVKQYESSCGVYKLYDKDKNLIYIGKSYTFGNRIVTSGKEQKAYYLKIMVTDTQADANLLEQYYISEERPQNNGAGLTFDKLTVVVNHHYKFSPIIKIFKEPR